MARKPSLLRRVALFFGRITLTLAVLALAGFAIVTGREVLAARAEAVPAPVPAPVTPVTVARIQMEEGYSTVRAFSGQVEAQQQTDLAFEIAGTVATVLVREGAEVQRGDVLARLDTRLLEAELDRLAAQRAAMEARVELARRTAERQAELRDRGFASEQMADDTGLTLVQLQAEIAGIDAARQSVEINLSKADLVAPFDGAVASRAMDAGAIASPGAPVLTLLEGGAPRFRAGLAPELAASLAPGTAVTVDLGGQRYDATLSQLAPDLDPATRARVAFFDIAEPAPAGLTGTVAFEQGVASEGAWVPLSALRNGPRGTWQLLTVTDGTVEIEAAEVKHIAGEAAFIRGTFTDGAAFIPEGAHRLVPGQAVSIAAEQTEVEVLSWAR
ncbi:MAG: efflux RND transporter periplasmic adaptor subunit [Shimia sp.]